MSLFSQRNAFQKTHEASAIVHAAPESVRNAVKMAIRLTCPELRGVRDTIALTLCEDTEENWSREFLEREIGNLLNECEWYRVYDIVEIVYQKLRDKYSKDLGERLSVALAGPASAGPRHEKFRDAINLKFAEISVGWRLEKTGELVLVADDTTREVVEKLPEPMEGMEKIAREEMKRALECISHRPIPDSNGAVSRSVASLECLAKELTGSKKKSLGEIAKDMKKRHPQDTTVWNAIDALYGIASERGRHLTSGKTPSEAQARLVVVVSAALSRFMYDYQEKDGEAVSEQFR